jgi:starch phosphorylase
MTSTRPESTASLETLNTLVRQYGCGPVRLTGTSDALYERHLFFDNVADLATVGARERYEALARSIRDVLSQRWVLTEQTYERENPKRVYYLSMEFLIGRSLANNITNLLVSPFISEATKLSTREWLGLLEAEPDAGLGNGGLGRLAACFLDSMATMQLPAMGYGLRYEYGMFRQSLARGWQREQPDNWLRRSDPWEVARSDEKVEVHLNCSHFPTRSPCSSTTHTRRLPFPSCCGSCSTRRISNGIERGTSCSGRSPTRTTRCCRRR